MQSLYIIRIIACHKPWRYSRTIYTTNKKLFDFIKSQNELIDDVLWSEYCETNEDEDFDYYDHLIQGSVNPIYPFVVLNETEIYTQ